LTVVKYFVPIDIEIDIVKFHLATIY